MKESCENCGQLFDELETIANDIIIEVCRKCKVGAGYL